MFSQGHLAVVNQTMQVSKSLHGNMVRGALGDGIAVHLGKRSHR
jgi:hypothetical protein